MLTAQSLIIIKYLVVQSWNLYTIPYGWDSKSGTICISDSRLRKTVLTIIGFHSLLWGIYSCSALVKEAVRDAQDFYLIILLINYTIFYLWVSVSFYNSGQKKAEVAALFAGLTFVDKSFQGMDCFFP